MPENLVLTGFYDWGRVAGEQGKAYELKGYGLALAWAAPGRINVKASWARRDGNNPNPTNTGRDQDGSLEKNRFWLSLSVPFDFGRQGFAGKAGEPGATAMSTGPVVAANTPAPLPSPASAVLPAEEDEAGGTPPREPQVLRLRRQGHVWLMVVEPRGEVPKRNTLAAIDTVEQWREAWISRDATAYFARYAEEFAPARGQPRSAWEAERQARLKRAGQLTLELSEQKIQFRGDTAIVSFKQHYRSAHYSDVLRKILTLKWQDDAWRIVAEREIPLAGKDK